MAGRKEPTISDVLKEIKDMHTEFNGRVKPLEDWKIAEDAYRAALAKVKDEEKEAKMSNLQSDAMKRWIGILKQAGIVLGLVIAILYAWATTKGIPTP